MEGLMRHIERGRGGVYLFRNEGFYGMTISPSIKRDVPNLWAFEHWPSERIEKTTDHLTFKYSHFWVTKFML